MIIARYIISHPFLHNILVLNQIFFGRLLGGRLLDYFAEHVYAIWDSLLSKLVQDKKCLLHLVHLSPSSCWRSSDHETQQSLVQSMPPQRQPVHDWSCQWNDTEGKAINVKSLLNWSQGTLTMDMVPASHQPLWQIVSPG